MATSRPTKRSRRRDGWVVIAAGNDQQFARLAAALGHPEWVDDPQLRTNPDRVRHRERLNALVADVVKAQAASTGRACSMRAGVPCAPMLSLDEVLAHPQCQALGMLQEAPDGGIPLMGVPLSFDGERPPFRTSAAGARRGNRLVLSTARTGGGMNIPENLNTLTVEAPEPHLWIVRFNRPEVLNALNTATSQDMRRVFGPLAFTPGRPALRHPDRHRRRAF